MYISWSWNILLVFIKPAPFWSDVNFSQSDSRETETFEEMIESSSTNMETRKDFIIHIVQHTDRQTDITWAPCHQPTGTAHAAATVRNHWLLLAAGRSLNAPQGNSRRGSVVFKDVVQFWTLLSDSCLQESQQRLGSCRTTRKRRRMKKRSRMMRKRSRMEKWRRKTERKQNVEKTLIMMTILYMIPVTPEWPHQKRNRQWPSRWPSLWP